MQEVKMQDTSRSFILVWCLFSSVIQIRHHLNVSTTDRAAGTHLSTQVEQK